MEVRVIIITFIKNNEKAFEPILFIKNINNIYSYQPCEFCHSVQNSQRTNSY